MKVYVLTKSYIPYAHVSYHTDIVGVALNKKLAEEWGTSIERDMKNIQEESGGYVEIHEVELKEE